MVRALAALALLYAIGAGSASRRLGEAGVCPAGQVVDPLEERTFANSASECPSGKIGVRSNRKVRPR
jgi:hypothetical protein